VDALDAIGLSAQGSLREWPQRDRLPLAGVAADE